MASHTGRPRGADSRARTRRLLELVAQGEPLADATRAARVKPERVLHLLDDPMFFAAWQAVRAGTIGPTAALVHLPADLPDAEAA